MSQRFWTIRDLFLLTVFAALPLLPMRVYVSAHFPARPVWLTHLLILSAIVLGCGFASACFGRTLGSTKSTIKLWMQGCGGSAALLLAADLFTVVVLL